MAVIGTAYVAIRAVADKLKGDIEDALKSASGAANKAGEDAGKNFKDGFKKNQADLAPDLDDAAGKAAIAGQQAGQQFKSSMKAAADGGTVDMSSSMRSAEVAAENGGDRAGNAFIAGFEKQDFDGIGGSGGKALGDGFARGIEGGGASTALSGIGARMIALIPLIAILVGALSSLASGFFAMSAAIGPALGTLAAIPALVLAAASAFGLLKTAFSGIGETFKLGMADQDNATQTATKNSAALAAASRAVENAQRGMADAVRQNAEALRSANRAIEDAQRNLANTMEDIAVRQEASNRSLFLAERSLRDALERQAESQIKLTEARVDARKEIIELQFALEDSVLGQERAAINLERARRQLQLMSGLPPDNLLRREAELAYKEAELAVRKTAEQFTSATDAAEEAKKAGVENAESVVDSRNAERDAAEAVADAQYRLNQAREDQARSERDNAERQMLAERQLSDAVRNRDRTVQDNSRRSADAARALEDAMRAAKDAAIAASPAMSAYGKALDKLVPSQRAFVEYLMTIRDEWKALKTVIADNVLAPAQAALEEFMTGGLFDAFSEGMDGASKSVGNFFTRLQETMESPIFKGNFKTVMDSNVTVVDDLGAVMNNLVRIFFAVAAAAAPMTERFSAWVETVTGDWADRAESSSTRMETFFKKAGDVAAQLGRIIGNISEGLFELGQTAAPAGQRLLDSFEGATEKFASLVADDDDKKRFKKYFDDVAINVEKIGSLIVAVGVEFGKLGDNQGIGDTAKILEDTVIPALGTLFDLLNSKAAPAVAKFLGAIGDLILALSESPALTIFLGTMTALADALTWLATNPVGQGALVVLGTLLGVSKSLALVKKVLFIDQIVSGLGKMDKFISAKTGSRLSALFSTAGDDAEKASKRIADAFDPDLPQNGKGTRNTPDGVDKGTAKAGEDFKDNLRSLARQFKLTGDAKDRFILNLQRLSGQFAATGAAASTGAAGAASTAVAGDPDLLLDTDVDKSTKGADKLDNASKKADKSGGKLKNMFSGLKGAAATLSVALFGVGGATLVALAPFILVGAAIAAVVLLFKGAWDRSEKLREAFDTKLRPALEKLKKAIQPAIDAFKEMVDKGLKKLGDFIADVLLPKFVEFVEWLAENIPPVVEFFVGIFDWISEHWGILSKILFAPFFIFTEVLPTIWRGVIDGVQGAANFIKEAWSSVTTFFSELPGKIGGFFTGIWDTIQEGAQSAVDWIIEKWEGLLTWFSELPGRIGAFFVGIWDGLTSGLQAARDWVTAKIDEIVAWVASMPGRFVAGIQNLWGFLTQSLGTAAETVRAKINQIVGFVTSLPGKFTALASRIWSFLTSSLGTAIGAARERIESIVRLVGGLPRRIGDMTRNMWDGIKNSFKNAINWIISRWNNFRLTVGGGTFLGQTIPSFTLNTPDIPYLAQGGIVPATPGGRIVVVGEGGRDEKVTPLNSRGMSSAEERIIELLEKNQGGQQPIHITINPPPGTDVQTLARLVSLELGFQRA